MKNILITGANGQLGRELGNFFPEALALSSSDLDISDISSIDNIDWSKVSLIINAAAYTNVDGAETAEGRLKAWKVNASGTQNLSKVATKHDITIIHISSDYVFDGRNEIHQENESLSPLGVYGQTKAAADLVVSLLEKYYILRTSWVIGEGKNFVKTMLDLGNKNISPTVVSDQFGRLTFTTEIVRLIDYIIKQEPSYGTYNISNSGSITNWSDITREIFKLARLDNQVFDTTTQEYYLSKSESAPRPLNSTLDLSKIEKIGFQSRDWHEDLNIYIKKELKNL